MDVELHENSEGQVALVTGATRGLGAQIASELVGLSATVYAGARNTDDVGADDRHTIDLDVTSEEDIAAATERIDREVGRLDVLVNNAGIGGPSAARSVAEGADTPVWCCRFAPGSRSGKFWHNRAVIEW